MPRSSRTNNRRQSTRGRKFTIPAITPIGSDAPVSETLPKAVRRIARALRPEKIILFGSYAYGNPTPDSDVDLLVVWDSHTSPNERFLSVARLLRPRLFPLDLLVYTPKEMQEALARRDFLIHEIVTRGKVLYERTD